ncbi:calcium/calmodulin-dependent protein kinase type II subunit beta-like [Cololabis saira]|uniref:calcium/calmodulin-dependent protein kinase type II subunit beta-like n=1 Tax=Cololabis saira TaxID=129043 RepID=UPI002AD49232|nr:calcium/calmodulin-dependent protein kinase type II subunit beta-like [Cololabis saira]XP_061581223.1 calcium/calmodulin-dependent protein kinase type II subunit beta-like [Cololabis saira]XP_061581224.1 calcium/calmodulin-dependent protein kinase type II subunit beta-like [Cololabis saira]XP_061581225.1 calcium/calmodulin-dependent protein kinase type II subunit beta-like [Cololabis saira]
MGKEQSTLAKKDYVTLKETEDYVIATKGDDKFFIKKIPLRQRSTQDVLTDMKKLQTINHAHIVNCEKSYEDQNIYYVVTDYCQGGSLAAKISQMPEGFPEESKVLSWIVEICIGLKTIHDAGLLHKALTPENIFFTDAGIVCVGGFGSINEKSTSNSNKEIHYLAPEVSTEGTYDAKSDIWSVGCILFELCRNQSEFPAETVVKFMPEIIEICWPNLEEHFSPELCELLNDILKKDPCERPTASEILIRPFVISCLLTKCKTTVEELQTKLKALRDLADDLERVHEGASIGSLAGGVIGAVGGVTSIVGLILAPFTLGASLIVTGVGVGVGAVGGLTAGVSNITNMVNQSADRKAVHSIIKEFEQKISAVVTWLQEISDSLQTISSQYPQTCEGDGNYREENLKRLGLSAGKGLSGVTELIRLATVVNIGRIAAQASRTVRVAEVATGVLSGLFIAVDIFFIAMDAKEIHNIRKARAEEERSETFSSSASEIGDFVPDQARPLSSPLMQGSDTPEPQLSQNPSSKKRDEIRSEIMKFVLSLREAVDKMQRVLDELEHIIDNTELFQEENELEWQDM